MPKADIRPVLQHYGADCPPPRGGPQKIRCPFHEDRTASATVNYEKGRFKCFVCEEFSGDAFDIIMNKEACDFPSSLDFYSGLPGASVDNLRGKASGKPRGFGVPGDARPHERERSLFSPRVRRRRSFTKS